MRIPYELFLALRYLRFHRGQAFLSVITWISVAGVTVGTAALIIALSLMAGMVEDVRQRIHSGSAHLTVLSAADPEPFPAAAALIEELESVQGVRAAAPVLYMQALLTFEGTASHAAELQGIDVGAHTRVILNRDAEDSPFAPLTRPTSSGLEGILLGEVLAAELGAVQGDVVRAVVPDLSLTPWGVSPRTRAYEVVGSYESGHFQEDQFRAYVRLESARRMQREPDGSSWIEVRIDDLRELESMKQVLRRQLSPAWLVVDLIEQNQDLLKALRTEKFILFLAIGLIVVVAAMNIVSTLILMVNDKIKEIGTLSALGARPVEIGRVFVFQGSAIGVVGTAAGLALGSLASWWLDAYQIIRLNPEVYYLDHIPFAIQAQDLISVGAAVVLVSMLATLYPAWKAARLDPLEAIRYE